MVVMQYRPLKELTKLPNNPRTIKKDDMQRLMASVISNPDYFEARPLILSNRTGNLVILGGNQRYEAAKRLKLKEVPTHLIEGLDEAREQEIIIRDNVANGDWDMDMLANEWSDLPLADWGLELPGLETPTEVEEDEAPALATEPPISELGRVYQLGRHRVMCGDSTDKAQVDRLMDGRKADMVFTDPPYGISFSSNQRTVTAKFAVLENDHQLLDGWVEIAKSCSIGFVFVWTTWKVFSQWEAICAPFGETTNVVIWDKGGGGIGNLTQTFSTDHEMALVYNRGSDIVGKRIGSVWSIGKDAPTSYQHPTQKPIALAAQAIQSTTKDGQTVLDLFLGSGSTLIACEQTDRICYGMELDPQYVDVIRKRYATFVSSDKALPDNWQDITPEIVR